MPFLHAKKFQRKWKSARLCCITSEQFANISEFALSRGIKKIVVTQEERRECLPIRELLNCRFNGIEVIEGNSFYEMLTGKLIVRRV